MRPRAGPLLAILLLAAGFAQGAGWAHVDGGPGRSRVAALPEAELDVRGSVMLGEEIWLHDVLATPRGWIALVEDEQLVCGWVRIESFLSPLPPPHATFPCPLDARPVGYDAPRDQLLACVDADTPEGLLRAYDAETFEERWRASPLPQPTDRALPTDDDRLDWFCNTASLDAEAGVVYAPFSTDNGRNRITAIRASDGAALWTTVIATSRLARADDTTSLLEGAEALGDAFTAVDLAVSDTGVIVRGLAGTGYEDLYEPGLAWLSREGELIGGVLAQTGASQANTVVRESRLPATAASGLGQGSVVARGELAAGAMGTRLFVVDPLAGSPARIADLPDVEPLDGAPFWRPPAWAGDLLVVPLRHSVIGYDASDITRPTWTWIESLAWDVEGLFLAPPDQVLVLAVRPSAEPPERVLFRLDGTTGSVMERIPIPHVEGGGSSWRITPLGEAGILLDDAGGRAVLVGPAESALVPSAGDPDLYPAPGAMVRVAPSAAGATSFLVSWGEGEVEPVEPGAEATHQYAEPGPRQLRVRAIYADGRTGTWSAVIQVGGTPQDLNAIQLAFSDKWQNVTWGIIGIVVTFVGGGFSLHQRRRRTSALSAELHALQRIADDGRQDPGRALRELGRARRRYHANLSAGALDDAQFGVLDGRAARLARAMRERQLAEHRGRLSAGFLGLTEAAMEDGILDAAELRRLLAALDAEAGLTAAEREAQAMFLRAWADEG